MYVAHTTTCFLGYNGPGKMERCLPTPETTQTECLQSTTLNPPTVGSTRVPLSTDQLERLNKKSGPGSMSSLLPGDRSLQTNLQNIIQLNSLKIQERITHYKNRHLGKTS